MQRVSEAILPDEKDRNGPIWAIQSEGARKNGAVLTYLEKENILWHVTQIRSDKKLGKSHELGNLTNYLKLLNNEKSEELG